MTKKNKIENRLWDLSGELGVSYYEDIPEIEFGYKTSLEFNEDLLNSKLIIETNNPVYKDNEGINGTCGDLIAENYERIEVRLKDLELSKKDLRKITKEKLCKLGKKTWSECSHIIQSYTNYF